MNLEFDDPKSHSSTCVCETCIQNHPERMIYLDEWDESMIDHDYQPTYEERLENAMHQCGYMPEHKFCSMAGSEFCDWGCPLMELVGQHGSEFFSEEEDAVEAEAPTTPRQYAERLLNMLIEIFRLP